MTYGRLEPLSHYIRVDTSVVGGLKIFELSCRLCPYECVFIDPEVAAIVATIHADWHKAQPPQTPNESIGDNNAAK